MDYKIPAVGDMPEMIVSFVENEQHDGPFGARGMAEPAMIPSAPAIAIALHNAVGVRMRQIPLTPERVLNAIKEKNK